MSNNDYASKINNIMDKAKEDVRTQIDRAYQHGYEDAKSELGQNAIDLAHEESDRAYQQGLEDAWEAARKITEIPRTKREFVFDLSPKTDLSFFNLLKVLSIQEAIAKIKAYEDKQKQDDWRDIPSDKMTLEQARRAVKELRAEVLKEMRGDKA